MIDDREAIARLLFSDQMINAATGELTPSAFPMDELLEKQGRDGSSKSVSVDRCQLIEPVEDTLRAKAESLEKPEKERAKWGYGVTEAGSIREIETSNNQQAFEVYEDEIVDGDHPLWDHAHAKLVRAKSDYGRGLLRGSRDKLIEVFQNSLSKFD